MLTSAGEATFLEACQIFFARILKAWHQKCQPRARRHMLTMNYSILVSGSAGRLSEDNNVTELSPIVIDSRTENKIQDTWWT